MRYFFLLAISALLRGQGGAPVEGTVISSATHTGIAGVAVTIESPTGGVAHTATTDAGGAFRIGTIERDGEYKAHFGKIGFREMQADDPALRPFRVAAATGPVRLHVVLRPQSQFRGRVVDGGGRPVSQARVEVLGTNGDWVMSATPGKDGSFVYQNELPSGTFFLRAVPLKEMPPPPSAGDTPMAWAPTYYPDGTEQSHASRIVWRGEGDAGGYDIRLRAVPVFPVSGTVVDDAGKPVTGATVKLLPVEDGGQLQLTETTPEAQVATQAEGAFEFPAVRPGHWALMAEWKRGNQILSAAVDGRVSRTDWQDVRIHLEVPFTVRGVIEAPDSGGATRLVILESTDLLLWQRTIGPSGADGRFEIPNVHAGRYKILIVGAARRVYLDSVQFGGREVLGQAVDLADGSLPLRVVYKSNGGMVRGSAEHCAAVIVFPKDPALQDTQFTRVMKCDAGGQFGTGTLRPGDYFAAAVSAPEYESLEQLLDELSFGSVPVGQLAGSAESVRVEAGQSTTVTLKVTAWPGQ
jgi:hypothetical protein